MTLLKVVLKKPKQDSFITYCDEVDIDNKVILMTTYSKEEDEEDLTPYYARWFYNPKKDLLTISPYEKEK